MPDPEGQGLIERLRSYWAPSGERLGLAGWMRALNFQNVGRTPRRRWERLNVHLVGDESELVAYTPGPRGIAGGATGAVAGQLSVAELRAGETGARVRIHPSTTVRVDYGDAPLTLANVATVNVRWADPRRVGSTTMRYGTQALPPSSDGPQWSGVAAPSPEFWVPPQRFLYVWRTVVNNNVDLAFWITEPGSVTL